jgi:hypothetical protein
VVGVKTLDLRKERPSVCFRVWYDLGWRLGINVVAVTMTGVEHELGLVGFGEVALIVRVENGRLLEEESLVRHEVCMSDSTERRGTGVKDRCLAFRCRQSDREKSPSR